MNHLSPLFINSAVPCVLLECPSTYRSNQFRRIRGGYTKTTLLLTRQKHGVAWQIPREDCCQYRCCSFFSKHRPNPKRKKLPMYYDGGNPPDEQQACSDVHTWTSHTQPHPAPHPWPWRKREGLPRCSSAAAGNAAGERSRFWGALACRANTSRRSAWRYFILCACVARRLLLSVDERCYTHN